MFHTLPLGGAVRWTVSSSHVSRRWCSGFIQRSRLSFTVSLFSRLYDRSINASHEGVTTRQTARKRITSTPKMSGTTSANMHRMKKDESFLGKLGGTLVRKKRSKEGWPSFYYYTLHIIIIMSWFRICSVVFVPVTWCWNDAVWMLSSSTSQRNCKLHTIYAFLILSFYLQFG